MWVLDLLVCAALIYVAGDLINIPEKQECV
jgi:hypothetical protein